MVDETGNVAAWLRQASNKTLTRMSGSGASTYPAECGHTRLEGCLQAPAVTRFVTSAADRTSASGEVARRSGAQPGHWDARPSAFATARRRGPHHCRAWRRPPDMLRAKWVARRLATAQRLRSAPRAPGSPAAQAGAAAPRCTAQLQPARYRSPSQAPCCRLRSRAAMFTASP